MEVKITLQNYEEEVVNSPVPVLLDFWATWCGPCRMIAPIVEDIAKEYDGKIKVGKVNVDEEGELAIKFGIVSIPTLLRIEKGEVKDKLIGYLQKDEIVKFMNLK